MMSQILLALPYFVLLVTLTIQISFFTFLQVTIYAAFSLKWTVNVVMLCKRTRNNVDIHTIPLSLYHEGLEEGYDLQ